MFRLLNDIDRIETILMQPSNVMILITIFHSATQSDFENLLEPLLDVLTKSVRMNQVDNYSSQKQIYVSKLKS